MTIANPTQLYLGLGMALLPALVSFYVFFKQQKSSTALVWLTLSALLVRLVMISADPYLQNWDERYHALVAKHLIDQPFTPMLRLHPILPYDYKAWCCNHVWVHKQPLFLWQMALSMYLLGVNEIALRLPSAIMGTLLVPLTYDICRRWLRSNTVAYVAAVLTAFAYYQIGLITARGSLDHNDLAFTFYVTASIWAWLRYRDQHANTQGSLRWAGVVGVMVAAAILNKWLTGLLVYGAWGLWLLLATERRKQLGLWAHLVLSVLVASALFVPWQVYTAARFPMETTWEQEFNRKHIFEALDQHTGNMWYHMTHLPAAYGGLLLPFLAIGLVAIARRQTRDDHATSLGLIAATVVLFAFFSVVVATKMPAFVYPAASVMISLIALGSVFSVKYVYKKYKIAASKQLLIGCLLTTLVAIYTLKPWQLAAQTDPRNPERQAKLHNTQIYKNLDKDIVANYVILNCKELEDVELMFYQNADAYQWYPDARTIDSLQEQGYRIAAFASHTRQPLPNYIANDTTIRIINQVLQ